MMGAIRRWAPRSKATWLPEMAAGALVGCFGFDGAGLGFAFGCDKRPGAAGIQRLDPCTSRRSGNSSIADVAAV